MVKDELSISREALLNVLCWDWGELKECPDSVDWIPALIAIDILEKEVHRKDGEIKR